MKLKIVLLVLVSFVAGALGGIASRLVITEDLRSLRFGPVRATRFDLVGEKGKTIASLGPSRGQDADLEAALVFLDSQSQPRLSVGVLKGPSAPILEFRGFDGKRRMLAALLHPDDEPSIQLSDKKGRFRSLTFDGLARSPVSPVE